MSENTSSTPPAQQRSGWGKRQDEILRRQRAEASTSEAKEKAASKVTREDPAVLSRRAAEAAQRRSDGRSLRD